MHFKKQNIISMGALTKQIKSSFSPIKPKNGFAAFAHHARTTWKFGLMIQQFAN